PAAVANELRADLHDPPALAASSACPARFESLAFAFGGNSPALLKFGRARLMVNRQGARSLSITCAPQARTPAHANVSDDDISIAQRAQTSSPDIRPLSDIHGASAAEDI